MSDVDELAKLAELRDKGVISNREFNRKKTDILRGKKKIHGLWWKFPLRVILTVAIIVGGGGILFKILFDITNEKASGHVSYVDTPNCDSDEAQKAVADVVSDNVASHVLNLKLLDLKNIKQLSYEPSTHERLCSADAYLNTGEERLSFRFFNLDLKKGSYLVEVK